MQSRMESCERVTRMVRGANNIGSGGNTGVGAGAGAGIVGGAVGGFSGPVGLNIGSQGVGAYTQVRAQAQMRPTQQGFPMGVDMG